MCVHAALGYGNEYEGARRSDALETWRKQWLIQLDGKLDMVLLLLLLLLLLLDNEVAAAV